MDGSSYLTFDDMKEFYGIVYGYLFENGKWYIGITTRPEVRKKEHLFIANSDSVRKRYFHNALNKYKYQYFVLKEIKSKNRNVGIKTLKYLEKHFIELFDSFNNGYNLTNGSDGNLIVSESTKLKLSSINKGRKQSESTKKKRAESLRGRKLSDDHKMRLSDAKKGTTLTEEHKSNISKSNTGKIFSDERKCKISKSLKGKKKPIKFVEKFYKPVEQLDEEGNCIRIFESIKSAAECVNIKKSSNISSVCNGKRKTAGGFKWRYLQDQDYNI